MCVIFLAFLVVGTAGGTCWAVLFRTVTSPVSLGQAMRLYRRERSEVADTPVTVPVMAPGVFSYATTGSEGLNLMGMSRSFPARTDMVVTSGSGGTCSTVEWVPIEQHTESTSLCHSGHDSLAISELVSHEAIAGATTTTVITCPATTYVVPPVARTGVRWSSTCHEVNPSESVTAAGQVLGIAPMVVGGERLSTLHVRLSFGFAGADQGTSPVDFWISTGRGLIVREQETAHITQSGVHYTEQMDSRLTTLRSLASGS
jgi:hypothetical protein